MCFLAYWRKEGTGLGALFHSYWILAPWEMNYPNSEGKENTEPLMWKKISQCKHT